MHQSVDSNWGSVKMGSRNETLFALENPLGSPGPFYLMKMFHIGPCGKSLYFRRDDLLLKPVIALAKFQLPRKMF